MKALGIIILGIPASIVLMALILSALRAGEERDFNCLVAIEIWLVWIGLTLIWTSL